MVQWVQTREGALFNLTNATNLTQAMAVEAHGLNFLAFQAASEPVDDDIEHLRGELERCERAKDSNEWGFFGDQKKKDCGPLRRRLECAYVRHEIQRLEEIQNRCTQLDHSTCWRSLEKHVARELETMHAKKRYLRC